jgi:broad specificity phosphatase PhoE
MPPDDVAGRRGRRPDVVLVRHGETEWSRRGRHTGRTDIPLTEHGRAQARQVRAVLSSSHFAAVWASPLSRAVETAELAGFEAVKPCEDLREWDYGTCEGRTTEDVRAEIPGFTIWDAVCPEGELITSVAARADRVIAAARAIEGDVLLFGHGHQLRVLGARWCGLEPVVGRFLALDAASVSVLGYERDTPVIRSWNRTG